MNNLIQQIDLSQEMKQPQNDVKPFDFDKMNSLNTVIIHEGQSNQTVNTSEIQKNTKKKQELKRFRQSIQLKHNKYYDEEHSAQMLILEQAIKKSDTMRKSQVSPSDFSKQTLSMRNVDTPKKTGYFNTVVQKNRKKFEFVDKYMSAHQEVGKKLKEDEKKQKELKKGRIEKERMKLILSPLPVREEKNFLLSPLKRKFVPAKHTATSIINFV